jgi:hypothetical protein
MTFQEMPKDQVIETFLIFAFVGFALTYWYLNKDKWE